MGSSALKGGSSQNTTYIRPLSMSLKEGGGGGACHSIINNNSTE